MASRSTSLLAAALASASVFAFACSSSTSPTTTADAPSDAGASAPDVETPDAAIACSDPTSTPSMPCGKLAWAASSTLSRRRNHHTTVIVETAAGPFLYAIAGVDAGHALPNVDRAPIGANGSVGAFVSQLVVPKPVGGQTGGVVTIGTKNVIVIAGGTGLRVTDLAYSTLVGDDGTLGPWKAAGSVLQPRMHPGSFVRGNVMYVLGGFNEPNVWDDIVRATVAPDGTVSAWTPAGKLPGPRSHMSVSFVDGYVYLTGGLDKSAYTNPPFLGDVSRGRLLEDGTIGEWTAMPALPTPIATHASFFYGGYLYTGGGVEALVQESGVWRATLGKDHALGAWEAVSNLPIARAHVHQFPMLGPHVYSVAGAIDFDLNSTDEIDIGTFR